MGRWWPVALLVGLGLAMAVSMAAASIAAPQANGLKRTLLSNPAKSAAYPDIDVGTGGLVAAVWTEGSGGDDKHNGPLKLGWISTGRDRWATSAVDDQMVFDAAVAVSGATVHVVWSRPQNTVRYTTCQPPNYACATPEVIATGTAEALQVDIAVEDDGTPHVVWVQDDNKVYYQRKESTGWTAKQAVGGSQSVDSEGPAVAYAAGFVHVAWTEWMHSDHKNSEVRYCRWGANESACDQGDVEVLSYWGVGGYLARNLSIAGDGAGNVYVAWDMLSQLDGGSQTQYAIGYAHSGDLGATWNPVHTYPRGTEFGDTIDDKQEVTIFRSGASEEWAEYIRFLRPHISVVVSGTATVPVLTWHARVQTGGGEEGLAQAALQVSPHKVYWAYATQPGSYEIPLSGEGYMHWASQPITLSTSVCGDVDMSVDSAAARLAPVGDLNEILAGDSPGDYLHTVYQEETGGGLWHIIYNNNLEIPCNDVYFPLIMKNASGNGGGG